jgi:hypothetical protein
MELGDIEEGLTKYFIDHNHSEMIGESHELEYLYKNNK